jgi:hypothetical protein
LIKIDFFVFLRALNKHKMNSDIKKFKEYFEKRKWEDDVEENSMYKFLKPDGPLRREIGIYDFYCDCYPKYCDVDGTLTGREKIYHWVNHDNSVDTSRYYILEGDEKVEVYYLPMCIDPCDSSIEFFTLINCKYVPSKTLTFSDGYFYSDNNKVGTAINYVYSKSTYDEYYENMRNKKSSDEMSPEDAILQR